MASKKSDQIEIKAIEPKVITVKICGDSDLVLNCMNAPTKRALMNVRKDKAKDIEKPNKWEEIITSVHWLNPVTDYSEEGLRDALENNSPCITSTGLKKSLQDAVVQNKISTYSTGFRATVNVVGQKGVLIPVKFAMHHIDELLMSPQRGKPVLVRLNRFTGWSADITLSYLENVYGTEQILNILNLAGFGIGIGSSRSSGFGRYHVTDA